MHKHNLARDLRAEAARLDADAAEIAALLGGNNALCLSMAAKLRSEANANRELARALEDKPVTRQQRQRFTLAARAGYARLDLLCGITGALACLLLWLACGGSFISSRYLDCLSAFYR